MSSTASSLLDYCSECVADCGVCARMDTVTEPDRVRWDGGRSVVAFYECPKGHYWHTAWDAQYWLYGAV